MLPLDKLTEKAYLDFASKGCDPAAFDAVVSLDMNLSGDFGQTWLALNRTRKCLYCLSGSDGALAEFSFALTAEPYVDNYTSLKRLLAHACQEPVPRKGRA